MAPKETYGLPGRKAIMRISLDDDLYWRLVRLAADQEMRYDALLEKWIRDAESHRDQIGKNPSGQDAKTADLPHDSSRPRKGTYSPEELDQIRSLYKEGKESRIIAQTMNRGRSGIIYAINAMKKRGEL
jgi:hypothetical protein